MKLLRIALILFVTLQWGCDQRDDQSQASAKSGESHSQAIKKFQDGQKQFKELIGTVRDQESYDKAAKALDQVVTDFRRAAASLEKLDPPDKATQAKFNQIIAAGHTRTEPTGEDMLTLMSIKTREEEVSEWMAEFVSAGQEAGAELRRLYGPIDYASAPVPDLKGDSTGGAQTK